MTRGRETLTLGGATRGEYEAAERSFLEAREARLTLSQREREQQQRRRRFVEDGSESEAGSAVTGSGGGTPAARESSAGTSIRSFHSRGRLYTHHHHTCGAALTRLFYRFVNQFSKKKQHTIPSAVKALS